MFKFKDGQRTRTEEISSKNYANGIEDQANPIARMKLVKTLTHNNELRRNGVEQIFGFN